MAWVAAAWAAQPRSLLTAAPTDTAQSISDIGRDTCFLAEGLATVVEVTDSAPPLAVGESVVGYAVWSAVLVRWVPWSVWFRMCCNTSGYWPAPR